MIYTSTVTSKGTITLPAPLRRKLRLKEGDTVEISLYGNTIVTKPRNDWEEFFENTKDFGKKARDMIAAGQAKSLLTNAEIARAAEEGRRRGY